MCGDLEGIARDIHERTLADERPSALDLAWALGFTVEHSCSARPSLVETRIIVPLRVRIARQESVVAHELAHGILAGTSLDSERSAKYLGGALLVPRGTLLRDLRETGLDLGMLKQRWPHVSLELLARRVTEVRSASGAVFDRGRFRWRFWSPWLEQEPRPSSDELALAARCFEAEAHVTDDAACAAYVADSWPRAVVMRAG